MENNHGKIGRYLVQIVCVRVPFVGKLGIVIAKADNPTGLLYGVCIPTRPLLRDFDERSYGANLPSSVPSGVLTASIIEMRMTHVSSPWP